MPYAAGRRCLRYLVLANSMREASPPPGRWMIDARTRRVVLDGQAVALGSRAFDLLLALADAPGTVVGTSTLLQRVWPGQVVEDNNLHVHISALRRLLGPDAIRTVRGRGYQLTLPPDPPSTPPGPPSDTAFPGAGPDQGPPVGAGNLPHDLRPLIGREADLQTLGQLLERHRTVTVTGPAGVGKTSLALAAARDLSPSWAGAGGVWLVELAGAADPTPLAEAVARVLDMALPGLQQAEDELVDVLRTRRMLLVLDNCEHRAADAGRFVERLVRATSGMRVLVTSQMPLHHPGEQVFRLGTLALPPPEAAADEARAASAVALFQARVAAHDPRFLLDGTDQGLADVVAICERLDGLPLAIELAAARVPLLGLKGLRQRLGQQLTLLGGGPRGAPARQQTLRAAIAWSHALLSDEERRAFRRLGIFAGGFSVGVAQAVLDLPFDDDGPVLDLLGALRDKSLLASPVGGPGALSAPRLRLLESTRAFALEQLQACGEHTATVQRLARAMLRLFKRDDGPRSFDAGTDEAQSLAPDLDNLRAALDGLAKQGEEAVLHIELAGASAWIWSRLGLRAEGLRRCRQALARVDDRTPPALEARLQLGWASLVHRRGEEGDSLAAARAAALYEALGDRIGRFRALSLLAFMQALEGDEEASLATLEALADTFEPAWGAVQWGAYNWTVGACLTQFGRFDEATAIRDKAMRHVEVLGNDGALALAWTASAQLAAMQDDFVTAVEHAQRAVAAARHANARGRLGMALGDLACYLCEQGRVDEARPIAREAVSLRAQEGTLGLQLDQLARLACADGRHHVAAMAQGRADLHHRGRQGRRERYLQGPHQRTTAALAAAMSAIDVQEWKARGAALGDDEVARLTLRD